MLSEPLGDLQHSMAEHGEVPAPCLQLSVTPTGGTQCEGRRCVRDPEGLGLASTERGAQSSWGTAGSVHPSLCTSDSSEERDC